MNEHRLPHHHYLISAWPKETLGVLVKLQRGGEGRERELCLPAEILPLQGCILTGA